MKRTAISKPFRSKFEQMIAFGLLALDRCFEYEPDKFTYTLTKTYTPDFKLPNGIYVESKGVLRASDITKLRAFKEQHPEVDLRLLFQNAKNKVRRGSKTTYGEWATKNGFIWAEGMEIPDDWYFAPRRV